MSRIVNKTLLETNILINFDDNVDLGSNSGLLRLTDLIRKAVSTTIVYKTEGHSDKIRVQLNSKSSPAGVRGIAE